MAEAYYLFDQCRTRQLVVREVSKPEMKKTMTHFVSMPTGYSILPYSGGLLDQPAFLVDAFAQFMNAERTVAMKQLTQ